MSTKTSQTLISALPVPHPQIHTTKHHQIIRMSLVPQINLPVLIWGHSLFLSYIGLRNIFRSSPTGKPDRQTETSAMSGITTLAIGVAYLATSYMPIEQNQFLHASVPVRIFLALLAILRLLVVKDISKAGKNEMLFVALYDGLGAIVCGWQLGNFTGRAPSV